MPFAYVCHRSHTSADLASVTVGQPAPAVSQERQGNPRVRLLLTSVDLHIHSCHLENHTGQNIVYDSVALYGEHSHSYTDTYVCIHIHISTDVHTHMRELTHA